MQEMIAIGPGGSNIPPKIQAAQQYLHFAVGIRFPGNNFMQTTGDTPQCGAELSPREQAAYDAATDVMISYFRGEMDFGDVNAGVPRGGEDDMGQPALQPVG